MQILYDVKPIFTQEFLAEIEGGLFFKYPPQDRKTGRLSWIKCADIMKEKQKKRELSCDFLRLRLNQTFDFSVGKSKAFKRVRLYYFDIPTGGIASIQFTGEYLFKNLATGQYFKLFSAAQVGEKYSRNEKGLREFVLENKHNLR